MTLETLRRLVVLERCIKEAERMHPPLIMLMRRVVRDLAYGGHTVPAGRHGAGLAGRGHRLPEVFRDPDRYDPDRFGPGREEDRSTSTRSSASAAATIAASARRSPSSRSR